jgi:signal transduction histidine kinase
MIDRDKALLGQLERELNYYRREYNDLGARLLRLQEEQSRAFREARRSRTVAKLIREAYRLVDRAASPDDVGALMLETIVENAMCDRGALLRQLPGDGQFLLTHALGFGQEAPPASLFVASPPRFFFTTAQTRIEPPAYELTQVLRMPYVLWSYDPGSGYALILGNRSEGNVSRPFETGDQELIEGALSVYVDILMRKQAEAELRSAKQETEEAHQTQSSFLAILSHELRTPLNAILGFSEILRDQSLGKYTADRCQEYAGLIHDSGSYLLELISGILEYSRISREQIVLAEEWVDMVDLIATTTRAIAKMAADKSIHLSVAIPQRLPPLRADPVRMRQVLNNLLSNAIKFTPAGGRVEVRAALDPDRNLRVEVEDTGIGMTAADIPRALQPFIQIENAYTRSNPGTGLGLPITQVLVDAHGGSLAIESEPHHGTRVVVTLPADRVLKRDGAS